MYHPISTGKKRAGAAARTQVVARIAAQDGLFGAGLGLFLASALIASDFDIWRTLTENGRPLTSLAGLVAAIVVQSAIVAALGEWRCAS